MLSIFVFMNIQQFQYVLAVVDLKNFDAAAEKCCVTQSTLSTMIGRLEEEIGVRIFNRKTKPVSITTEGEQIVERFRIINHEIESLDDLVQELKGEATGEIKIGVIPTIAPYLLPLFLTNFAEKFPKVKVIVKEMTTSEIQHSLKVRSLDVGILALPLDDSDLIELELYTEPFLIYDCTGSKRVEDTIDVGSLDYSKLWLLREGHCLRTQIHQICESSEHSAQNDFNIEFESSSMDSLLRFTKVSKGMTILPYLASSELALEERTNLLSFKQPTPVRSVGLVTYKFFLKKRLLKALQDIIQDSVKRAICCIFFALMDQKRMSSSVERFYPKANAKHTLF